MENSVLGRAVLVVGTIAAAMIVFAVLLSSCNTKQKVHTSSYRLMCWLPNGEIFYNGTSSMVKSTPEGIEFVPDVGPQTGMYIHTTNSCTWAKL